MNDDLIKSVLSLAMILRPGVLSDHGTEIGDALSAGGGVILENAIKETYAERVWSALDKSEGWRPYEGSTRDFHFHHHNLYDESAFPQLLNECKMFFESGPTKSLIGDLSGRDCSAPIEFAASWYMPGDFSLPHDDCVSARGGDTAYRQVAFLWHLTKDWDRSWGGHLYWGPSQKMFAPRFNSLILFGVHPGQMHFVAPVAGRATGKRLTINGWWNGSTPYPEPLPVDGRLSLRRIRNL